MPAARFLAIAIRFSAARAPSPGLLLLIPLVLALGMSIRPPAALAQRAVSYAAGWNLVSGPAGSHLVGAAGSLYTLQPGDSAYQQLPATSSLRSCWGYWAYFPSGGSLDASGSSSSEVCVLQPDAGQWMMAGNPALIPAVLTEASAAYVYQPDSGYRSAPGIAAGYGAWVTGSDPVYISARLPEAPTARTNPAALLAGTVMSRTCAILPVSHFAARIEKSDWAKTVSGVTSGGMWVYMVAAVTNEGGMNDITYLAAGMVDERGRRYAMADLALGPPAYAQLRDELGVKGSAYPLDPGETVRVLWVFEVPSDVRALRMVPAAPFCP